MQNREISQIDFLKELIQRDNSKEFYNSELAQKAFYNLQNFVKKQSNDNIKLIAVNVVEIANLQENSLLHITDDRLNSPVESEDSLVPAYVAGINPDKEDATQQTWLFVDNTDEDKPNMFAASNVLLMQRKQIQDLKYLKIKSDKSLTLTDGQMEVVGFREMLDFIDTKLELPEMLLMKGWAHLLEEYRGTELGKVFTDSIIQNIRFIQKELKEGYPQITHGLMSLARGSLINQVGLNHDLDFGKLTNIITYQLPIEEESLKEELGYIFRNYNKENILKMVKLLYPKLSNKSLGNLEFTNQEAFVNSFLKLELFASYVVRLTNPNLLEITSKGGTSTLKANMDKLDMRPTVSRDSVFILAELLSIPHYVEY